MIRFWCQCGRQLQASENAIGQPAQCPLCRRLTIVPPSDVPRTADFPPVPDRRGTRINEYGEITRSGPETEPVPKSPFPDRPRRSDVSERRSSGMASAALVLGVLSFPCMLSVLTGIPALIAGIVALCNPRVRSGEMAGFGSAVAGVILACVGMLLFVPLYLYTDSASKRLSESNNLKEIGLAMHNYHDTYGHLPAATAYQTKDGRPGLSWRVAILPFIEQENLYRQFKLDESWDSPHNLRLLPLMPKVYLRPGQKNEGMTHYRVFVGPGTAFEDQRARQGFNAIAGVPSQGLRLTAFLDGTSNTILVATAKTAVPWTRPDELDYWPNRPLPQLDDRLGGVLILLADGSTLLLRKHTPEATIRAMITRNGGEVISLP